MQVTFPPTFSMCGTAEIFSVDPALCLSAEVATWWIKRQAPDTPFKVCPKIRFLCVPVRPPGAKVLTPLFFFSLLPRRKSFSLPLRSTYKGDEITLASCFFAC